MNKRKNKKLLNMLKQIVFDYDKAKTNWCIKYQKQYFTHKTGGINYVAILNYLKSKEVSQYYYIDKGQYSVNGLNEKRFKVMLNEKGRKLLFLVYPKLKNYKSKALQNES